MNHRMWRAISFSIFAAIVLVARIGQCGECDFYNDFGSQFILPITSNGVIAKYVFSDEANPLPAGVKLTKIVHNTFSSTGCNGVTTFQYDAYGRVWKTRGFNRLTNRMELLASYSYESNAPDALITRMVPYDLDPVTKITKPRNLINFVYSSESGVKKLKRIDYVSLDKTSVWTYPQPDYNPLVFENYSVNDLIPDYLREIFTTRDAQNHAITVREVISTFPYPLEPPVVDDRTTTYKRDANGRVIRSWNNWPSYNGIRTADTIYLRDSTGLLTEIRPKGRIPSAWFYYSNQ